MHKGASTMGTPHPHLARRAMASSRPQPSAAPLNGPGWLRDRHSSSLSTGAHGLAAAAECAAGRRAEGSTEQGQLERE